MNTLIESEINKIYEMNQNLLSDGVVPPSINDYEYLVNYYIEGEEMDEDLASVLAKSIMDSWADYVDHWELYIGCCKVVGKYYQIGIMDQEGEELYHFCYLRSDYDTPVLLLKALHQNIPNILWID